MVSSVVGIPGKAQDSSSARPASNLDLYRTLAEEIATEVGQLITEQDSVTIDVRPKESAWYVEGSIMAGFRNAGLHHTESSTSRYAAEFGLTSLRVRYEDVRRDGLFGDRIVDRNIHVQLATKVSDRHTGRIIALGERERQFHDTIELSSLQLVENPNLPITRGTVPGEGLFSSIVEPVILLGAIGVAIFLLFNVRS